MFQPTNVVLSSIFINFPLKCSSALCRPQHQQPTSDEVGTKNGAQRAFNVGRNINNPPVTRWVYNNLLPRSIQVFAQPLLV